MTAQIVNVIKKKKRERTKNIATGTEGISLLLTKRAPVYKLGLSARRQATSA
jgi:hypothetical protein